MAKGEHLKEKDRRRTLQLANIIICGAVFTAVAVSLLVMERPTVSETEKRTLTKWPDFSAENLFGGKYTDQISEYFNDTVPYRDFFKEVSAAIKKNMGIQLGGISVYGDFQVVTEQTTAAPEVTEPAETAVNTAEAEATATEATTTEREEIIAEGVEYNGQIVVNMDGHYWGIAMYGGGDGASYASYLNGFREEVNSDVNVYCMLAPTSGAFYTPSNFAQYNASHLDSINAVYDSLDDGILTVDAYGALEKHRDEYIFTRTDHHWQPLGAYYAAQEFARVAEAPFETLDNMEKVEVDGFIGSLYTFTQDANLAGDPEVFTYYVPQNEFKSYYYDTAYNFDNIYPFFLEMSPKNAYSTFMGGDQKIVRVETDVDNERKLIVIKDSYGNAEIPFYMNSFSEIYVVDMRYFDLNIYDFIEQEGITDVLFTCCTFSAVGPNAEKGIFATN